MKSISTSPIKHTAKFSTQDIILAGMFAAVLAIISQISIPMPSGIPLTIQVFGIALTGVVLGWRLSLLSTITYILIGAVGLPVFAGFRGGLESLTGLTGGYILSWPIMIVFCGIRLDFPNKPLNLILSILLSLTGLMINEAAGILQWAALAGDKSIQAIFTYSLVAFIPKDIIITIAAVILGRQIRKLLIHSGFQKQA